MSSIIGVDSKGEYVHSEEDHKKKETKKKKKMTALALIRKWDKKWGESWSNSNDELAKIMDEYLKIKLKEIKNESEEN